MEQLSTAVRNRSRTSASWLAFKASAISCFAMACISFAAVLFTSSMQDDEVFVFNDPSTAVLSFLVLITCWEFCDLPKRYAPTSNEQKIRIIPGIIIYFFLIFQLYI